MKLLKELLNEGPYDWAKAPAPEATSHNSELANEFHAFGALFKNMRATMMMSKMDPVASNKLQQVHAKFEALYPRIFAALNGSKEG